MTPTIRLIRKFVAAVAVLMAFANCTSTGAVPVPIRHPKHDSPKYGYCDTGGEVSFGWTVPVDDCTTERCHEQYPGNCGYSCDGNDCSIQECD